MVAVAAIEVAGIDDVTAGVIVSNKGAGQVVTTLAIVVVTTVSSSGVVAMVDICSNSPELLGLLGSPVVTACSSMASLGVAVVPSVACAVVAIMSVAIVLLCGSTVVVVVVGFAVEIANGTEELLLLCCALESEGEVFTITLSVTASATVKGTVVSVAAVAAVFTKEVSEVGGIVEEVRRDEWPVVVVVVVVARLDIVTEESSMLVLKVNVVIEGAAFEVVVVSRIEIEKPVLDV